MPEMNMDETIRGAWKSQQTNSAHFAPSQLRKAAWRFRWRSRIDDSLAIITNSVLMLFFAAAAIFGELLLCRIGSALLALGLAYGSFRFLARYFRSSDKDFEEQSCSNHYLQDLKQRMNFIEGYSSWGVLATFPGAVIGIAGWILDDPSAPVLPIGILACFLTVQYINFSWGNRLLAEITREMRHLQEFVEGVAEVDVAVGVGGPSWRT